jgi:hypothetical protein
MKFSPEETWLLITGAAAAILALWGLFKLIDDAVEGWRAGQQYKRIRRIALRQNINAIIIQLCDQEDPLLDRALQDSIIEYRVLC